MNPDDSRSFPLTPAIRAVYDPSLPPPRFDIGPEPVGEMMGIDALAATPEELDACLDAAERALAANPAISSLGGAEMEHAMEQSGFMRDPTVTARSSFLCYIFSLPKILPDESQVAYRGKTRVPLLSLYPWLTRFHALKTAFAAGLARRTLVSLKYVDISAAVRGLTGAMYYQFARQVVRALLAGDGRLNELQPLTARWLEIIRNLCGRTIAEDCFKLAYTALTRSNPSGALVLPLCADDLATAWHAGWLSDNEFARLLLEHGKTDGPAVFKILTDPDLRAPLEDAAPGLGAFADRLAGAVAQAETEWDGEAGNGVSGLAGSISRLEGTRHFVEILAALGKAGVNPEVPKDVFFAVADKRDRLSRLVGVSYPGPAESADTLRRRLAENPVPADVLSNAAAFAPQWRPLLG